MKLNIRKALPAALVLTALTIGSHTAHAQSCADSTTCNGTVGDANGSYSGIWATSSYHAGNGYMILTDGANLFVNAPNTTGAGGILFRLGNTGRVDDNVDHSAMLLDSGGNLIVESTITGFAPSSSRPMAITGFDQTNSSTGVGVYGSTVLGIGVSGIAQGAGVGVEGASIGHNGLGVYGITALDGGAGVKGVATTQSFGVYGSSSSFTGVYGISSTGIGVEGFTSSTTQAAVYAHSPSATGIAIHGDGNIVMTGSTATKQTAGSWVGTSDIRTKTAVKPYTPGLDEIERINPIRYHYNGLGGTVDDGEHVGVSAQELEKVAPEMISTVQRKMNANDVMTTAIKQVDPSDLTYMLINSVKELNAEVKNLKQQVADLKKRK